MTQDQSDKKVPTEMPKQAEPVQPPPAIVLTLGDAWAKVFEGSLARQFAKILHFDLANPRFKMTPTFLHQMALPPDTSPKQDAGAAEKLLTRLNHPNRQASELVFKFNWFVDHATHVLIDSGMLDTAIGQHVIARAHGRSIPVYGIGVDERSSPLAAAFLRGIVFPATADDLVKLVLSRGPA
jgi:hypothetical protein